MANEKITETPRSLRFDARFKYGLACVFGGVALLAGVGQVEQLHTDKPLTPLALPFAALCAVGGAFCRREGNEDYKRAAALEQADQYHAILTSTVQQLGTDARAASNAVADALYELAATQEPVEPEPTDGIDPPYLTTYL